MPQICFVYICVTLLQHKGVPTTTGHPQQVVTIEAGKQRAETDISECEAEINRISKDLKIKTGRGKNKVGTLGQTQGTFTGLLAC